MLRRLSDIIGAVTRRYMILTGTKWGRRLVSRLRAWSAGSHKARYRKWFRSHTVTEFCRQNIRRHISQGHLSTRISVLLLTHKTAASWLQESIESVVAQLYPHWELCIALEAPAAHIQDLVRRYRDAGFRIHLTEPLSAPAEATNAALALATGEFVALLGEGDRLSELALFLVAEAISEHPDVDLIYSDADSLGEDGLHRDPFFKPDWDPELILGQDYFNHLGVYRRQLAIESGAFRRGLEAAGAWDLLLRCSRNCSHSSIHHIPRILCHRRASGVSALTTDPKRSETSVRAVLEHIEILGERAEVTSHPQLVGMCKTRFLLGDAQPLVSIIIPTRDRRSLLEACVQSITQETSYRKFEILIVDNQSTDPAALRYLQGLERSGAARILQYDRPFNWSAINNFAVPEARGELVTLVNNDVEVIASSWLEDMAALAMRSSAGAVGAKLLFADRTVQHAGILLGITGIAGHAHRGSSATSPGYFGRLQLLQNYSAVTGACLMVRKDRYLQVRGMDERNFAVAYNDVDFCLKLRELGYRNTWTPDAVLLHLESASRGYEDNEPKKARLAEEGLRLREKWAKWIDDDPCYNRNLSLFTEDFSIAWPPRLPTPCDTLS
jgi:GT2 family glycosyltransferase